MIAPAHRLSFLLVAGAAALAFAASQPFIAPRAPPTETAPVPSPAAIELPPGPGPLETFQETVARPLFAPERRPSTAPAVATPAAPKVTLRLEGLVVTRERKEAIVSESGAGKRLRLREGDAVAGWTVRAIERDRVVLVSPGGELTLSPGR